MAKYPDCFECKYCKHIMLGNIGVSLCYHPDADKTLSIDPQEPACADYLPNGA